MGAEESRWFPQGDPRTPFDAAALLKEEADWPDWMETDEQRLSTWTAVLGQGQALPKASAAIEPRRASADSGSATSQGARRMSAVGGKAMASPRPASMPRAQRLQWILLASAAMAAMSGAAWLYYRSTLNRQEAQVAQARLGEQPAPIATPSVPGQNPLVKAPGAQRDTSPAMPRLAQGGDKFRLDSGVANAEGLEQRIAQANSNDMADDGATTEMDSTATAQPTAAATAEPAMESETATVEPKPSPMPMPMPMSATDRLLYADAMRQVLQAIKNQNFQKAETHLETARQLAMATPESDQVARLDMATKMSKRFDEAMRKAGMEMSAGSSFEVLGNPVAFVEANAERLVVRVAGKNESHPWSAMPVGIAMGLADLQLDQTNAIDLGCRGVYCGLSASANVLSKKLAREYLQKAKAADDGMRLPRDFEKLLDDQYDEPSEPASP
jgi:hypothetical protein